MKKSALAALAALVVTAPLLSACSGEDGPSITVYNAQHEQLLEEVAPLFEEETGIEVKLRSGSDLELANQLVQEGEASPADVFLTENSPAMSLVDRAGLFAHPLEQAAMVLAIEAWFDVVHRERPDQPLADDQRTDQRGLENRRRV